jgi:hypothetical protein
VPGTLCIWIVWSVAVVYVSGGEGRSLYVIWCCPKGNWGGLPASVVVAVMRSTYNTM